MSFFFFVISVDLYIIEFFNMYIDYIDLNLCD